MVQVHPVIAGRYGREMSAWSDSRWLFWLAGLRSPAGVPQQLRSGRIDKNAALPEDALGVTVSRTQAQALAGRRQPETETSPGTRRHTVRTVADATLKMSAHADVGLFSAPSRKLNRIFSDEVLSHCAALSCDSAYSARFAEE